MPKNNADVTLLPLSTFLLSRRVFVVAAAALTGLLFTGLFLHQALAEPVPQTFGTGPSGVASNAAHVIVGSESMSAQPALAEMHIANNGLVLVRGARVIAVNGSSIRVSLSFNGTDFTWMLQTNSNTRFVTSAGEQETIAHIQTGDIITASGMLSGGGVEPQLNAQSINQ